MQQNFIDLTGQRVGRYKVVSLDHTDQRWGAYWRVCRDDGFETVMRGDNLKRSPTYRSWDNMIQRTTNKKHKSYPHYGAKGVSVCDRWLIYENFVADMGKRPDGTDISRIDHNKNYEPSNCLWEATESNRGYQRREP